MSRLLPLLLALTCALPVRADSLITLARLSRSKVPSSIQGLQGWYDVNMIVPIGGKAREWRNAGTTGIKALIPYFGDTRGFPPAPDLAVFLSDLSPGIQCEAHALTTDSPGHFVDTGKFMKATLPRPNHVIANEATFIMAVRIRYDAEDNGRIFSLDADGFNNATFGGSYTVFGGMQLLWEGGSLLLRYPAPVDGRIGTVLADGGAFAGSFNIITITFSTPSLPTVLRVNGAVMDTGPAPSPTDWNTWFDDMVEDPGSEAPNLFIQFGTGAQDISVPFATQNPQPNVGQNVSVFQFCLFNRVLSDPEIAAVESYMAHRCAGSSGNYPCSAPSALMGTVNSVTSATLTWVNNSPGNVSYFEIWRETVDGAAYARLAVVPGTITTYTDTNDSSGAQFNGFDFYHYKVRAVNLSNVTAFCPQITLP